VRSHEVVNNVVGLCGGRAECFGALIKLNRLARRDGSERGAVRVQHDAIADPRLHCFFDRVLHQRLAVDVSQVLYLQPLAPSARGDHANHPTKRPIPPGTGVSGGGDEWRNRAERRAQNREQGAEQGAGRRTASRTSPVVDIPPLQIDGKDVSVSVTLLLHPHYRVVGL